MIQTKECQKQQSQPPGAEGLTHAGKNCLRVHGPNHWPKWPVRASLRLGELSEAPNTKHQTPSTKHQAPNTKHQTPEKLQIPNTERCPCRFSELGVWGFSGVWCLGFGVSCRNPFCRLTRRAAGAECCAP